MLQPVEIAIGYLKAGGDGPQQHFTLFQVAEDAVLLVYNASKLKKVIQVDRMKGFEIKRAIERATGGCAKIDYQRLGF